MRKGSRAGQVSWSRRFQCCLRHLAAMPDLPQPRAARLTNCKNLTATLDATTKANLPAAQLIRHMLHILRPFTGSEGANTTKSRVGATKYGLLSLQGKKCCSWVHLFEKDLVDGAGKELRTSKKKKRQ